MNGRLLLTAGVLSLGLGLSSAAMAQGMQPGMEGRTGQGQMGDEMGQDERPMKRSGKKMKKSMKNKKMMRSQSRSRSGGGMEPDGAAQEGM